MKTVTATDGDVLDRLLFDELGSTRQLVELLEANRGIAAKPFILSAGTSVVIPAKAADPVTLVRLYD